MRPTVERADAARTLPLRQRVLRPHQTLEELARAVPDHPDTGHYVATAGGEVISTGAVGHEPPPWAPGDASAWRLRGMATDEAWRGQGVGAAVLAAIIEHVAGHGGGLLWCNARTPALAFYRRAGFVTRGDPWVDPEIGPHIAMERQVEAGRTSRPDVRPCVPPLHK